MQVLVRHLVRTLLHSVKPPLSFEFALSMIDLLTSARYVEEVHTVDIGWHVFEVNEEGIS